MLRLSAKSVPPAVEIAEDPRADPRPGRAPLANARAPGLWLTHRAADPDGHVLPGPDLRWPHPRPPSDSRHHSGGPPPRARCRDLAPARPGSGVAACAAAGRRGVAPGGGLQPGTVLPPGAGADQRRAAHRLRAHAPLGSADGRDLRPAARTRAPGRRGRLLPRRHRPLVSVFRVQRGSHPVARAGRDAGLVDVVHRGRLLHADRDPLRGRDGLSLLAVPTLRRVGDGSALSRDLSAPRTGMMSENPNDRDPRRVSPHPVLTAYYRDEAGHRRFLTRLFDDTASQYDRISDLMSLGSGAWYCRYALRRAGLTEGMKVLDVAVGTGAFASAAMTIVGPRGSVVGVDPSTGMLAQAHKKVGIRLSQGEAEALPFRDEHFDFTTMGYALRHVADLRSMFAEHFRVRRPGGTLLIVDCRRPRSRVRLGLAPAWRGGEGEGGRVGTPEERGGRTVRGLARPREGGRGGGMPEGDLTPPLPGGEPGRRRRHRPAGAGVGAHAVRDRRPAGQSQRFASVSERAIRRGRARGDPRAPSVPPHHAR